MSRFSRQSTSVSWMRQALRWRPKAKWPLLLVCAGWVFAVGAFWRVDLALSDFLGHTKGLSFIHAAEPDSPASYVTSDGTTFDAKSYQDAHDSDTQQLNEARSHLLFLLALMLAAPTCIFVFLMWAPTAKRGAKRLRGR